ncbi:MAG: hypothetical protein ISP70_02940 [Crocinitomicaceae bacterium]|nr:hypothetical protein [Crocinitomicaceae bacterium]
MKLFFISLIVCSTCFCQENPWKSNKPENSSSLIQNGTNPWVSNLERDNTQNSAKANLSIGTNSNAYQFGFDRYISPGGVIAPAVAVGIPVIGILSLPLVPLFTAIPMENKEKPIVNMYKENNPEASPGDLRKVRKGIRTKRWRNSGIGVAIGAAIQTLVLYLIIEGL